MPTAIYLENPCHLLKLKFKPPLPVFSSSLRLVTAVNLLVGACTVYRPTFAAVCFVELDQMRECFSFSFSASLTKIRLKKYLKFEKVLNRRDAIGTL